MSITACNSALFKAIVSFFLNIFSCRRFSIRHLALVPALMFLSAFSLPALAQIDDAYIQKAYIAFFNRPADASGFNHWRNYTGNAQDLLTEFSRSEEYLSDFDGMNNIQILTRVYRNLFGRAPDNEGLTYWAGQMGAGWVTIANVAYEVLGGAQGTDLDTINHKTIAAIIFTESLITAEEIDAYAKAGSNGVGNVAKEWLASVSHTIDSLEAALYKGYIVLDTLAAANGGGGSGGNASVAACFSAPQTVNYAMITTGNTDNIVRRTVGPTTYNGQAVIGQTRFFANGSSATEYIAVTNSGVSSSTIVYSNGSILTYSPDFLFAPLSIQPGQSFSQRFSMSISGFPLGEREDHTTFVGFETITLAGKTFSNVCHFSGTTLTTPSGYSTGEEIWVAPGYGVIKATSTGSLGSGTYQYNGDL